jgi:hypothetical protein
MIPYIPALQPKAHAILFDCSLYETAANYKIEGCVVNADTGQPLAGMNVYMLSCGTIETNVRTTDIHGHFAFIGNTAPVCINGTSKYVISANGVTVITVTIDGCYVPQCNQLGAAADNPAWGQWVGDVGPTDGNGYATITIPLQKGSIVNVPVAGLYSNTGFASLSYSTTTSTSASISFSGSAIVTAGFQKSVTDSFSTSFAYQPLTHTVIAYPYYMIPYYCAGSTAQQNGPGGGWSCSQGLQSVGISGAEPSSAGGQYIPIPTSEPITNPASLSPSQSLNCGIQVAQGGSQSITSQHDLAASANLGLAASGNFYAVDWSVSYSVSTSSGASGSTTVTFSSTDSQPLNFLMYPATGNCPISGGGSSIGSFGPEIHVWDMNPTPPDFSMRVDRPSLSLGNGAGDQPNLILAAQGGFNGNVKITWSAPPFMGVSPTDTSPFVASGGASIGISIQVFTNAPCGATYQVTIYGANSQFGLTHSVPIQVSVNAAQYDFCLSTAQGSADVTGFPGSTSHTTLNLNLQSNLATTISFSAALPSGFTATFNPASLSVTSGSTASTGVYFDITNPAPNAGSYSVNITATGGGKIHWIIVSAFYTGEFYLNTQTNQYFIPAGSSGSIPIYGSPQYGFVGKIWLSTPNCSANCPNGGVYVSYTGNPINVISYQGTSYPGTANLNIGVASSVAQTSFVLTVTGTYQSPNGLTITSWVSITINITPPQPGCTTGCGGGGGGGGPPRPV